jgi:hypothetical protein
LGRSRVDLASGQANLDFHLWKPQDYVGHRVSPLSQLVKITLDIAYLLCRNSSREKQYHPAEGDRSLFPKFKEV